ncbi:MAG: MBL fold metallo-hydrolase [Deltaproteobacteria bacterium]|nr:MBL fold metallo-hydrolase [Deltaproteobacteria bacterium]
MWSHEPGPVSEHVEMLGNMAFPCFSVTGTETALVDAGITVIAALLEERFGDGRRLDKVLLTHTHYDHVGCMGVLRRLSPGLKLLASSEAQTILAKPKVHDFILDMNRTDEESLGYQGEPIPLALADLQVDRVLGDGDILELGAGVTVQAFAAPGHTRCSMVFLIMPDKVLVGGESLGAYVSPEEIQAQGVSSFNEYLESLHKLATLDFEILAMPHQGVRRGPEVKSHAQVAIRTAEAFRSEVLQKIDAGADLRQVALEMSKKLRHGISAGQPEKAFQINLASMIRSILAERGENKAT